MNRRGFTLVEIIISFSMLMILLSATFYALGQGMRIWRNYVQKIECHQVASLVLERIRHDIRTASEILPSSSSGQINLRIGSEIIGYRFIDGKVGRQKGSSLAYLTEKGQINKLCFEYPAFNLVAIELDDFATFVSLRN